MKTRLFLALAIALAIATSSSSAMSQSVGRAINRHEPSEPGSDWFTAESLDLRGHLRLNAGVVSDWTYNTLVLERGGGVGGSPPSRFIVDQIMLHTRGSLVLFDRLRVSASLPVAVYQHGDDPVANSIAARAPRREQAFGDLRLGVDTRLFGTFTSFVRGAAGAQVFLPTGRRGFYTSDGAMRFAPRLLFAGNARAFDWAMKLGVMFRAFDGTWEGQKLGHEAFLSLAAGVKVNDRFVLGPELQGAAIVTGRDALRSRAIPIELLLGARAKLANDFQLGTAIGGGITSGDGAPTMRVLAMFEWAPDICVDKDGDGICANEDACPEVDGVRTNDRRTNGCPADRDRDGILDRNDKCPDEAGSPSTDPAFVGCLDSDKDGVPNKIDACPDVVGVPSSKPEENGCPRPPTDPSPDDRYKPPGPS